MYLPVQSEQRNWLTGSNGFFRSPSFVDAARAVSCFLCAARAQLLLSAHTCHAHVVHCSKGAGGWNIQVGKYILSIEHNHVQHRGERPLPEDVLQAVLAPSHRQLIVSRAPIELLDAAIACGFLITSHVTIFETREDTYVLTRSL
jgi:hypothetical protein